MSPTEERLQALLDKWVASLQAHLRYAALSDEAYWQVQPWTAHQRPNRWIIELALSRATELRRELDKRREAGDEAFASAMELMSFLANLVGSENIARFIPLADPARERPATTPAPAAPPVPEPPTATTAAAAPAPPAVISLLDEPPGTRPAVELTREMPRPAVAAADTSATRAMPRPPIAAETSSTRDMPRPELPADASATREMPRPPIAKRDSSPTRAMPRPKVVPPPVPAPAPIAEPAPAAAPGAPVPVVTASPEPVTPEPVVVVPEPVVPEPVAPRPRAAVTASAVDGTASDEVINIVIADAIRLRKWGREWHELATTIARMAGRPELGEIRRILRTHKADIEAGVPRRPPPVGS